MSKAQITINNFDSHLVVTATDQSNLIDHVPAMVYQAFFSPRGLILHKDRPNFTLPQLRFGRHNRYFKQIVASYDRDGRSNGVLLSGEKGSGKSLMAEEIGNWMIKQDLPVIMVNEPMDAQSLTTIIRAVGPCMVYFDEFGKVYHEQKDRERLLSLFSDTSFTGVMFVITGNDQREFSDYLHYRPQRFLYSINYGSGIDKETLEDVLKTMRVDEGLHQMFHEYIMRERFGLNIDSLLTVVRQSAGCKTAAEVADRCEILNVPKVPKLDWYIKAVEILDDGGVEAEPFGYDIILTANHDGVYVMLKESRRMAKRWDRDEEGTEQTQSIILPDDHVDVDLVMSGKRVYHITLGYGFGHNCQASSKTGQPHPSNLEVDQYIRQPELADGPVGRMSVNVSGRGQIKPWQRNDH